MTRLTVLTAIVLLVGCLPGMALAPPGPIMAKRGEGLMRGYDRPCSDHWPKVVSTARSLGYRDVDAQEDRLQIKLSNYVSSDTEAAIWLKTDGDRCLIEIYARTAVRGRPVPNIEENFFQVYSPPPGPTAAE